MLAKSFYLPKINKNEKRTQFSKKQIKNRHHFRSWYFLLPLLSLSLILLISHMHFYWNAPFSKLRFNRKTN